MAGIKSFGHSMTGNPSWSYGAVEAADNQLSQEVVLERLCCPPAFCASSLLKLSMNLKEEKIKGNPLASKSVAAGMPGKLMAGTSVCWHALGDCSSKLSLEPWATTYITVRISMCTNNRSHPP